jgi:ABC-2 type transport system ATP-binding protein
MSSRYGVVVEGASFSYGDRPVLRGVNLAIRRGEIYGLLGVNGAGKTTLMKAICGRLTLSSGRIAIDGRDPVLDRKARRAVSFVPQDISVYQHMTARENLEVFGRFAGVPRGDLKAAVRETLHRAGLDNRKDQLCRTLSGGYQRRVNICASIMHNPSVVVLDEPTVGIDIDARSAIHSLIEDLRDRGAALLIATHDLEQAQLLCDRIGIMDQGQICVEGEPSDLLEKTFGEWKEMVVNLARPPSPHGENLLLELGFVSTQTPLSWFGWMMTKDLDAGQVSRSLARTGTQVKEIRVKEPDLASLFLVAVGKSPPS